MAKPPVKSQNPIQRRKGEMAKPPAIWQAPPRGYVKINYYDGSLDQNTGYAGIGVNSKEIAQEKWPEDRE
ncbi:hypothetical protein CDL15_Pgr021347 [Punica granatum]|uniref:Uncharacterized protein n=1 Tax=Punica granatum TaxID=22663 RepID=A0A218WQT6_PUNGR|nr:hypothetical protein CDL15_Pgr021347 [Punica granatum]